MRTPRYSLDTLRAFFKTNVIATIMQIKAALGTSVDMTVFRKLRQISYHSSYSHQGKYYTLDELARFNKRGLWSHKDVKFSRYGTLIDTAQAIVSASEQGCDLAELRKLVGVEVKEALLTLVTRNRIQRETIDDKYVYFSTDSSVRRRQRLARLERTPRLANTEGHEVLAHEVRAAILLFVSLLDEKQRRLYAGLESPRIGRGGDSLIADLLHLDVHTIARGRRELVDRDMEVERVRKTGGGRHAIKKNAGNR